MTGAAAVQILNISGTMFRHFSTYAVNAGRPYLNLDANVTLYDNGSNYYQSATEAPASSGSVVWGKVSMKMTSNTNLRFSGIGTDAVTRVGNITLV